MNTARTIAVVAALALAGCLDPYYESPRHHHDHYSPGGVYYSNGYHTSGGPMVIYDSAPGPHSPGHVRHDKHHGKHHDKHHDKKPIVQPKPVAKPAPKPVAKPTPAPKPVAKPKPVPKPTVKPKPVTKPAPAPKPVKKGK